MKITCELLGGLGNQLFQVATTLATAWDNNIEPVFENKESNISGNTKRNTYFNNIFRNLTLTEIPDKSSFSYYTENYDKKYRQIKLSSHTCLSGYFQTSRYFNKYRQKIVDLFTLEESDTMQVDNIINFLRNMASGKKLVGIHVRRTDYIKLGWDLEAEYYTNAKMQFNENTSFIVFSDDVEWCKNNISNCFIINEAIPEYIALFLLSKMDAYIMSPSSFSWWAVYLGNINNDKYVVAPYPWFKNENYCPTIYENILPRVSVIIPSFERYDSLISSIESVLNQTHQNIELIIIDDCSKDSRYENLKNIYPSITLINLPINMREKYNLKAAQGLTRNEGLSVVTGQWIAFLDDDDIWIDKTKISNQLILMNKYNCKMCSSNMLTGNGSYKDSKHSMFFNNLNIGMRLEEYVFMFSKKDIEKTNYITTSSCIVSKSIIDKAGLFPSGVNEDYDLWLRCMNYTDNIYVNALYVYYDLGHAGGKLYTE